MRTYAVVAPELREIALLNSGTALFLSVGSAILGYVLDDVKDAYGAHLAPPFSLWILAAVSLGCFILSWWIGRRKSTVLEEIERASETERISTAPADRP